MAAQDGGQTVRLPLAKIYLARRGPALAPNTELSPSEEKLALITILPCFFHHFSHLSLSPELDVVSTFI